MSVTRVFSVLAISVAVIAWGCSDDSGSGGSAGSGGTAGSGGSAGAGGTAGSAGMAGAGGDAGAGGTAGDGGSGGMAMGCEDDVGGRPALTGQPSVTPSMVAVGGTITATASVNDATGYVRAFVTSAFNELEGDTFVTTTGGETLDIEIALTGDNIGDVFYVGFLLCTMESECSGPTRNTVQYVEGRNDEEFYFISVTIDGASTPAESKFSDCNRRVPLTITPN